MNKRPKPSRKRKGASAGIVICFVAAIAIVGTYTLRDYRQAKKQEQAITEETDNTKDKTEKTEQSTTETNNNLVLNTNEDDTNATEETQEETTPDENAADPNAAGGQGTAQQTAGQSTSVNFTEDSQLLWPVDGNILLNYSMDKTVYFSTLDQYKYNPALIISGAEGDQVIAGTTGIVKSIDVTAQTGTTVNIDIGNGYELLYGQLKEVPLNVGDYVEAKTVLGYVSQPTKYYSVEGCNVYFEMRKDGQPVNPLDYMAE